MCSTLDRVFRNATAIESHSGVNAVLNPASFLLFPFRIRLRNVMKTAPG
jgi:hypothetical protein